MAEPSSRLQALRRLLPLAILVVLVCVFLWPVLFGGRILLPGGMLRKMSPWNAQTPQAHDVFWNALTWDCDAHFYPSRLLIHRALGFHELALWNPYQMCGMPCMADGQSGALYPLNLLFLALFSPDKAMGFLAAFHLLTAGLFTFVFLRGLGLGRTPSTFGGIAFMLGGYSVAWLHLPVFLASGVWLPLTLHLSHLAYERRSFFFAALAGMTITLSLLGGHPQIAFYGILATALYWVYMGITGRREVPIGRSVILAAVVFAIGLSLAAPQVLPMQELSSISHRGGRVATAEGYESYSRLAMPTGNLIGLMIPDFFGNPSKGTFWGADEYDEYCLYGGILPLILIPLAFTIKSKERRSIWFFGGLALLAMLMALGTGINRLFFFGIPGFTNSGSPARVLFLFMLCAAVLASFGLERILRMGERRERGALPSVLFSALGIVILSGALVLYISGGLSDRISLHDLLSQVLPDAQNFVSFLLAGVGVLVLLLTGKVNRKIGSGLLLCVLAADLLTFGIGYNPTCSRAEVYPSTRLTDFLSNDSGFQRIMPLNDKWSTREFPSAVLPPNTASIYRLFDVSGYDSLYPLRYKRLLNAAAGEESSPPENGNIVFARNYGSPVYNLLGVRWFVSMKPLGGKSREMDGCYVYKNDKALPRAFVVHGLEYSNSDGVVDADTLDRITKNRIDLRREAVIDIKDRAECNPWSGGTAPSASAPDRVRIVGYTCNTVTLNVKAASAGVLVLTDQYYPGWKAYVDKKETTVTRADYDFRAIPIQPGDHLVVFSFEPESFHRGLGIAWLGLIALICISIVAAANKFKR